MLSPSGSLCAATSCPEVSVPVRFPVPLPGSDGCCSEPLQRSRFTSHKSVWRRKGRERRLSLPLPQTLSHHPGQAATGVSPPPPCPVWLERCPKWIEEPPRENEPLVIPQPASRRQVVHRVGLPDEPQGPRTSSWGPRKMGAQWPFGDQSQALPSLLQLRFSCPEGSCSPISRCHSPRSAHRLLTDPCRRPPSARTPNMAITTAALAGCRSSPR